MVFVYRESGRCWRTTVSYVALLLAALWLFERHRVLASAYGLVETYGRYSVAQLLVTMTIIAVLVASIRYSRASQ